MAIILILIAVIGAYFSTGKYKGLTRVFFTISVAMFYFFVLVFFYLLSGKL